LGLEKDLLKGSFWIFTNQVLYEFLIMDEDRDVWKLQLSKGNFEEALKYAKVTFSQLLSVVRMKEVTQLMIQTDDQKEHVVLKQAEQYFSQGRYTLAAQYYAKSITASFEEIALKFMKLTEHEALQTYLVKKLECIKRQVSHQITLLPAETPN
jgi:hypothetical protein